MLVENILSSKGNAVSNQFIIHTKDFTIFQSYSSVIAVKSKATGTVYLNERYWDFSHTTGRYRNLFLGERKWETQIKIDHGIYKLVSDYKIQNLI